MFQISVHPPERLVVLTLSGFWTIETAERFTAAQQAAVASLGPPAGSHLTLADVRTFAVQRKEVVAIIRDLVVNARATSKRIALVGSSGLAKLQFARITERDGSRIFEDCDAARAWLLAK